MLIVLMYSAVSKVLMLLENQSKNIKVSHEVLSTARTASSLEMLKLSPFRCVFFFFFSSFIFTRELKRSIPRSLAAKNLHTLLLCDDCVVKINDYNTVNVFQTQNKFIVYG